MKDAKGHGSDPRGAHSAGVQNLPMKVFRGVGSSTGQGTHGDMLGDGFYVTNNPEYAKMFGDTVKAYTISPERILEPENHPRLGGRNLSRWAAEQGYDAIRSNIGEGIWQMNVLDPSKVRE